MEKTINSSEYQLFLRLLRQARSSKNINQTELATQLGSTQVFVSKCERGERRLDFVECMHWVEALGCSMLDFTRAYLEELERMRDKEKRLGAAPKN